MSIYLVILLGVYLVGMLVCWLAWRGRMMTGDWVQDLFTLISWPALAVVIAVLYVKTWGAR